MDLIAYFHTYVYLYLTNVVVATGREIHLVSGGSDNRLILWEARNGKVSHLSDKTVFLTQSYLLLFTDLHSKICSTVYSSARRWSVRATPVQFVLWMLYTRRTQRSWLPRRRLTQQSDCGAALKQKKVTEAETVKCNLLSVFGVVVMQNLTRHLFTKCMSMSSSVKEWFSPHTFIHFKTLNSEN